jgi:hypothetical protein
VPCLGAAFVIHAGGSGPHVTARLLSVPPLVIFGLISYSLYLWHWPIFSFAAAYLDRPANFVEAACLIVLAIILSVLSWRYVEMPFRQMSATPFITRRTFMYGATASLAAIGIGHMLTSGLPGRLDEESRRFATKSINPLRKMCHSYGERDVPYPAAQCIVPAAKADQAYDILVWGDSHADAFFPVLASIGNKLSLRSRQATKAACLPLIGVEEMNSAGRINDRCGLYNNEMVKMLQQEPRPKLVILVGRWSKFTEHGGRRYLVTDNQQARGYESSRANLRQSLVDTVNTINKLGISVLLVSQAPEFKSDPNFCFIRRRMFRSDTTDCIRRTRKGVDAELIMSNQFVIEAANQAPLATVLRLDNVLCDEVYCWAAKDGKPLYNDDDHINAHAASQIEAPLVSILQAIGLSRR